MSKWTDFRDSLVDSLKFDKIDEAAKQKVSQTILDEVLPPIETAVGNLAAGIKAQAPQETGWNRLRDGVVLPLALNGLVSAVKYVLTKTLTQTAQEG